VGLTTDIGAVDELFDVFDSSYSNYPGKPNLAAPLTEPQPQPFLTFSATPLILPSIDNVASSTDGIMLPTNQQAQIRQNSPLVEALSPIDAFLVNGLQSGSRLNEGGQSSNLTDIDYQSPLYGSTASGSATSEELNTLSESFTAAVRCNFEGCGHVCKDHSSLRHHRRHHVKRFTCREGSCASTVKRFSTRRDLARHQTSVHRKESRHCPHCQRQFNGSRLDKMKRHIEKFHSGG